MPDDNQQIVKPVATQNNANSKPIQIQSSVPSFKQGEHNDVLERFFTDNGVDYKITSDGSFKKSWVDADPKLFRVINSVNGKEVKMTNKKIQTLDWMKID